MHINYWQFLDPVAFRSSRSDPFFDEAAMLFHWHIQNSMIRGTILPANGIESMKT